MTQPPGTLPEFILDGTEAVDSILHYWSSLTGSTVTLGAKGLERELLEMVRLLVDAAIEGTD